MIDRHALTYLCIDTLYIVAVDHVYLFVFIIEITAEPLWLLCRE